MIVRHSVTGERFDIDEPERDYSQSGEQEVMTTWAATLPPGRFLDIGAGDGETFSNTRAIALWGWGGVVVEPAAWAFDRLVELYADRDDVLPVQAVVTAGICGLVRFSYVKDDHLSSVDPVHVAKWPQVPFRDTLAAAVSLPEMLDYMPPFQVVSIDAEGLTAELLEVYRQHVAWDAVRVLCLERERELPLRELLTTSWHIAAETPNNVILHR